MSDTPNYVMRKVMELAGTMALVQEEDGDLAATAEGFVRSVIEDCVAQTKAATDLAEAVARLEHLANPERR